MKKALVSVLRLAMFVGVLVLLSFRGKGPEAQLLAHQCVTFFTQNSSCDTCCSLTSMQLPNEVLAVDKPTGIQSILETSYNCGTRRTGCPVGCTGTYPQAVSDSGCCIASGVACASNEPCCPGLICRGSGDCGVCSDTGESCQDDNDCCGASDFCVSGKCATYSVSGCTVCPKLPPITCHSPCGSPIILDITGKGFNLTSAQNGVMFDITGVGQLWQMGWTAQDADNAFLALPGPDGLVHNGKQLFGNYSPQPPCPTGDSSCSANGFRALAVYDDPKNGGNGDGIIDARDAIFSSLRLWIDANHDGISQPNEIYTLPALGINSISLKYKDEDKKDQYGNVFGYRARLNPDERTDAGKTAYDVFFVILPQR